MSVLRVAVIDDEPLARARLVRLLESQPGIEIRGQHGDGASALAALAREPVDLAFLDIRMPELGGFAMLERMPPARRPLVVFVTAYPVHALDAFDVQAVDYLLKPLSEHRLLQALARAREIHALRSGGIGSAAARYPTRIPVPERGRMRLIPVTDIIHATARGNYVEITVEGASYLVRDTMASFASRLDPAVFVRVHRSRLVRIDTIEHVEPCGASQYWLRLRNGQILGSGRSYRDDVRAALGLGR